MGRRNAGVRRMINRLSRRRSSVVERVIGNDEVLSSILSGGTSKFKDLAEPNGLGLPG
jgi:hypothetical protein